MVFRIEGLALRHFLETKVFALTFTYWFLANLIPIYCLYNVFPAKPIKFKCPLVGGLLQSGFQRFRVCRGALHVRKHPCPHTYKNYAASSSQEVLELPHTQVRQMQ